MTNVDTQALGREYRRQAVRVFRLLADPKLRFTDAERKNMSEAAHLIVDESLRVVIDPDVMLGAAIIINEAIDQMVKRA